MSPNYKTLEYLATGDGSTTELSTFSGTLAAGAVSGTRSDADGNSGNFDGSGWALI